MKPVRLIAIIVALCALGYYLYQTFGNPNGKVYNFDKHHHVYYKGDGLKEEDAKKTAEYFKEVGYFGTDTPADLQISTSKDKKDDVTIKFVVDKNKIDPNIEAAYLTLGAGLNEQVFPGKHVIVTLSDEHMNDIKSLGAAQPATNTSSDTTRVTQ